MAEPRVYPNLGPAPTMPGWVRVFGIVFLILVVLIVVMLAGGHNPARHLPGADMSSHTPPSSMTEHGGHVP